MTQTIEYQLKRLDVTNQEDIPKIVELIGQAGAEWLGTPITSDSFKKATAFDYINHERRSQGLKNLSREEFQKILG